MTTTTLIDGVSRLDEPFALLTLLAENNHLDSNGSWNQTM